MKYTFLVLAHIAGLHAIEYLRRDWLVLAILWMLVCIGLACSSALFAP